MPETAEPTPPKVIVTRRAEHAREAFDADVSICEKALASGSSLHHIARLTSGIFDFAVEIPAALTGTAGGNGALAHRQAEIDQVGRKLSAVVGYLDESCRQLDSGPIIRAVLRGDRGALFLYQKLPERYFFGVTLNGSDRDVLGADKAMAAVADEASRQLGVQSLNWGGFYTRAQARSACGDDTTNVAAGTVATQHYIWPKGVNPADDTRARLCLQALDPCGLHYVGIYRHGRPVLFTDILSDVTLAHFFEQVTPDLRRNGYAEVTRQTRLQAARLIQILESIGSSRLVSLVLDVARGALYFRPFGPDETLVGVTLDQSQVEAADIKIRALFDQIEAQELFTA